MWFKDKSCGNGGSLFQRVIMDVNGFSQLLDALHITAVYLQFKPIKKTYPVWTYSQHSRRTLSAS